MKKLLLLLFLSFPFWVFSQEDSILYNGEQRTYLVHTPPSYDGSTDIPMVLALHGGGGSAAGMEALSELSQKADEAGFIVVYPEGVMSPMGHRTWNGGGCCGYAMYNNIDDVGFIDVLLDTLNADYNIDPDQVHATGLSNGAYMSYRLACELSERIASIAPVAGSMNLTSCNPQREVPVLHLHSYQDSIVPYEGGVGSGPSGHYNPPVDSALNAWASMNGCNALNDTVHDGTGYRRIEWRDCSCEKELRLLVTHDGGHSWPGGSPTWNMDPVSQAIDANDRIWSFFRENPKPCNATSLEEKETKSLGLRVHPVPSPGRLHVNAQKPLRSLRVLDLSGRELLSRRGDGKERLSLSLGTLEAGVYLLRIQDEEGNFHSRRVIKR